MAAALSHQESLSAFAEMIGNGRRSTMIGRGRTTYYTRTAPQHFFEREGDRISVQLIQDFIAISSTKFLMHITNVCVGERSRVEDTLMAYAWAELLRRGVTLPTPMYNRLLGAKLGTALGGPP